LLKAMRINMGRIIKIIAIALVAVGSFTGYAVIFGMTMNLKPAQLVSALIPSKAAKNSETENKVEGQDSTTAAVNDSTAQSDSISAIVTVPEPREDTIQIQIAQLNQEKAELSKLKSEITELLKVKSKADSIRVASLAKMYDGVEVTQLAAMIANMDDTLVLTILPRLKTQKAGKVLEAMPAERAARISSKLMGMN
jgi:flagellar motility protein MotE (MotC chaperone)